MNVWESQKLIQTACEAKTRFKSTGPICEHPDLTRADMKKTMAFVVFTRMPLDSARTHSSLRGYFQRDLTEVERPTLDMDGKILQAGVQPNKRVESVGSTSLDSVDPDCRCRVNSYLPRSFLRMLAVRYLLIAIRKRTNALGQPDILKSCC